MGLTREHVRAMRDIKARSRAEIAAVAENAVDGVVNVIREADGTYTAGLRDGTTYRTMPVNFIDMGAA